MDAHTVASIGWADLFYTKLNPAGNFVFAKPYGTPNWDECRGIAYDNNGGIIITSNFDVSAISFGTYSVTNSGGYDIFIGKSDTAGIELWATGVGGSQNDNVESMAIDNLGNIYLAGSFASPVLQVGSTTLNNASSANDPVLICLDNNGNGKWALTAATSGFDTFYDVACSDSGKVAATGYLGNGLAIWGNDTIDNSSVFVNELFIATADSNGIPLAAIKGYGNNDDRGHGIAFDKQGNYYVCGHTSSDTISIDTLIVAHPNLSFDVYPILAKHGSATGSSVGIQAQNVALSIVAFPNPADDVVRFEGIINALIKVYDMKGMLMLVEFGTNQFNIENFPKGIYSVRVTNHISKDPYIIKLVKN